MAGPTAGTGRRPHRLHHPGDVPGLIGGGPSPPSPVRAAGPVARTYPRDIARTGEATAEDRGPKPAGAIVVGVHFDGVPVAAADVPGPAGPTMRAIGDHCLDTARRGAPFLSRSKGDGE
ncbi:hypothetical protein [Streptomyces sp. NPDC000931]|uniref:hypothetical protein n=1 Tax=Streptomyces sp. NPDC000931 TaxID=3154372 RepID=UPI00332740B3